MKRMSLLFTLLVMIAFASPASAALHETFNLSFSTYYGGSGWEHARDMCADKDGNIYVVGGTASSDFPTTEGAYQRTQDKTGNQVGSGGYCDGFVCKFDPEGQLLWATLLGGPNYDRAYAVEVDDDGYVYVAGRAGPGFPVTAGAFQSQYHGSDQGIYGIQNGFAVKLRPDGSQLEWGSFVGVGPLCRDIAIDDDGDVYLPLIYSGSGVLPPASWFANAYMPSPAGGIDVGALKVTSDGATVLWATWMGGSANEVNNSGIRVDDAENVFLNFTTRSSDVPTTVGAHDRSYNGNTDVFVAKFNNDGSDLVFGTYFGSTGNEEGNSTHNAAVDSEGNIFVVTSTTSTDLPVTSGAFQSTHAGGRDAVAVKFSPTGQLLACTYIGGSGNEGADGVCVDAAGNVLFTDTTDSSNFPLAGSNIFQSAKVSSNDAAAVLMSSDLTHIIYSTYIGGSSYDFGRAACVNDWGDLFISGSVNGGGWPTLNAWQDYFAGGGGGQELCYKGGCYAGDLIVAGFRRDITWDLGGDANLDGIVNLDDFIILKQNYGRDGARWGQGDFNSDGIVDLDDFIILKQNYGSHN